MKRSIIFLGVLFTILSLTVFLTPTQASVAEVGTLDTAFGNDGIVIINASFQDLLYGVAATSNGTIFTAGQVEESSGVNSRDARMSRVDASGNLTGGWTYVGSGGGCALARPEQFNALHHDSDGTLIAGGYAQLGCGAADREFWIRRLNQTGGVVQQFTQPDFGFARRNEAYDLLIQPDGKVVAVGFATNPSDTSSDDLALVRWLANGDLDTSFGNDGLVRINVGPGHNRLNAVAYMADGRIVAGGLTTVGGQRDMVLVRLNPDGSPDTTFGSSLNGQVILDFNGFNDAINGLLVQSNGQAVAVGQRGVSDSVSEFVVARFNLNGTLDASFGSGGVVVPEFGDLNSSGRAIHPHQDGKMLVAGWTETGAGGAETRDMAVARLLEDGSPDPTFNGSGVIVLDAGADDRAEAITLQPNGDIIIAGNQVSGSAANGVVLRLIGEATEAPYAIYLPMLIRP